MRAIAVIVIVGLLGCAVAQNMIRQCLCQEVDGCKDQAMKAAPQCVETCKEKLSNIGDPDAIKQCVESKREKIMQVKECVIGKIGRICATEPNKMVAKQDLEALKEEAGHEAQGRFANSPLRNSPLFQGLQEVMGTLKEFGHCVKECVRVQTSQCFTKLGCGIDLPAKTEVQAAIKQCAGQKDPAELTETCNCFVNQGGVTQLASICPFIGRLATMGGGGGMMGGR